MRKNKGRSPDDCRWFFEMAAEGYMDQEYRRFREAEPIELTPGELACCQNAWSAISHKMRYWHFLRMVRNFGKALKKVGKAAAAVFLAMCLLFSGAFLTVSSFRVKVLNFLLEMERTRTTIQVVEAPPLAMDFISPALIPEGYQRTEI